MYEVCWEFEESWNSGVCPPPPEWIERNKDLPADLLLEELRETERELQAKVAREASRPAQVHDERYEFIEEIARGGAAVVWRVRDRHLQRETAVKYLLDTCDNREMRSRLEREARLCARLVHPGIVPIHELSHFADGRPFVSMKLVEGKTLLQLVNAEPRPSVKSLVEIFTKACQAVAHAHRKGIIHRDLKPGNIMVGSFGEVQVMDWGLAKEFPSVPPSDRVSNAHVDTVREKVILPVVGDNTEETGASDTSERTFPMYETTVVGSVCGTIAYMSPEQASGLSESVDARSDVFSLGAVLCRLLTGVPPYKESDQATMLKKAQQGSMPIALQKLGQSPHRKLAALAIKCMSLDPKSRPRDADAVAEQLNAIFVSGQRRQHAMQFLATAVAILLISSLIIFVRRQDPVVPGTDQQSPIASVQELIVDSHALKVLLQAGDTEIAFKSFEVATAKNSDDEVLHYSFAVAFLNKRHFIEAEKVIRKLIAFNPARAEFHYMLSRSLFEQGQLEASHESLLKCREMRESSIPSHISLEDEIAISQRALETAERMDTLATKDFPNASSKELFEIAKVCRVVRRIDLALQFWDVALGRVPSELQCSHECYLFLAYFVGDYLNREELPIQLRNDLLKLGVKWLDWEVNLIKYSLEQNHPELHGEKLLGVLASGRDLEVLYGSVDNEQLDQDLRARLRAILSEIKAIETQNQ